MHIEERRTNIIILDKYIFRRKQDCELRAKEYKPFEGTSNIFVPMGENTVGSRASTMLDYTEWWNFTKISKKAIIARNNSDYDV